MCKKKVSGTKMINFDNCERSEEMKGDCELRSVAEKYQLHPSYCGVVLWYDDVVVGIRGVEPCLKTSVLSHGMR